MFFLFCSKHGSLSEVIEDQQQIKMHMFLCQENPDGVF